MMSSESQSHFLPLSSSPSTFPTLRPRRPSLDRNREILATRGQRLFSVFSAPYLQDPNPEEDEFPSFPQDAPDQLHFLQRGLRLVGQSNPRYQW